MPNPGIYRPVFRQLPTFDQLLYSLATHQKEWMEEISRLVEENDRLMATLQASTETCTKYESGHSKHESGHSSSIHKPDSVNKRQSVTIVESPSPKGDNGSLLEDLDFDTPSREVIIVKNDGENYPLDLVMANSRSDTLFQSVGIGAFFDSFEKDYDSVTGSMSVAFSKQKQDTMKKHDSGRYGSGRSTGRCVPMTIYPPWFKPSNINFDADAMETVFENLKSKPVTVTYPCVLHPLGMNRLCWDWLWSLVLCYELWIVPIDLIFAYSADTPNSIKTLGWFVTFFFTVDIVLNFNTGYMDNGIEIMDRSNIAWKYITTWFLLDFVATIPWDEFLASTSGASSSLRIGKAVKIAKIVKMTKLLRVVKIFHRLKLFREVVKRKSVESIKHKLRSSQERTWDKRLPKFIQSMMPLLQLIHALVVPLQLLFVLLLVSHALSFFHRMLQSGDVQAASDFDAALWEYYLSLWWSFSTLTFGQTLIAESTFHFNTFLICVLWIRLVFVVMLGRMVLLSALRRYAEDAGDAVRQKDSIAYLKNHGVSLNTQVQVLHNIKESSHVRKMQRNFNDLMDNHLPIELSRALREELWCERLLSLGLIFELSGWRKGFLMDLAQVVQDETYASKVVIFKEGDPALIAYMVLKGSILVVDSTQHFEEIPPFTSGMWLGEKALVNPELRRSGTAISEAVTDLMAVPGDGFFSLLEAHDLKSDYHYFCVNELWKGLCGRCGSLGSHWSHECHLVCQEKPMTRGFLKSLTGRANMSWKGDAIDMDDVRSVVPSKKSVARDLALYVQLYELEWLHPHLFRLKILTLDDLLNIDKRVILFADEEASLQSHEKRSLDVDKIHRFRGMVKAQAKSVLQTRVAEQNHFFFLSHYKVEAGTEAALMRSELEQLITITENHPAQRLNVPIFLDSEDLTSLFDLIEAVKKSYNVVIMLTKGILTRPWCLIEIVTAIQEGIPCIPVNITKAGFEFEFPDAGFYSGLMDGTVLGQAGMDLLRDNGFSMTDVTFAVQTVLKSIAIPYSPHRPLAIRKTELEKLLAVAAVRDVRDNGKTVKHLARGRPSPSLQQFGANVGHTESLPSNYTSHHTAHTSYSRKSKASKASKRSFATSLVGS